MVVMELFLIIIKFEVKPQERRGGLIAEEKKKRANLMPKRKTPLSTKNIRVFLEYVKNVFFYYQYTFDNFVIFFSISSYEMLATQPVFL